jgi:hypothetical protein
MYPDFRRQILEGGGIHSHLKVKFTDTHSMKWQCHTKFLLVIAFPKMSSTVTRIVTIVTSQDFIFFDHYKIFRTTKAITGLTSLERLHNCLVFHPVHMNSQICNSTLCCPSRISDAMCDCSFSRFKNDHFADTEILLFPCSLILVSTSASQTGYFSTHVKNRFYSSLTSVCFIAPNPFTYHFLG